MNVKIRIFSIAAILIFFTAALASAASYTDGTFTGTAEDMQGRCTVELTIDNSAMTEIILKDGRSDIDLNDAQLADWIDSIIEAQELNAVDAISGATMSCDLLKKAIFAALKQAEN